MKEIKLTLDEQIVLTSNPLTFKKIDSTHPRLHAKELDRLLGYKISKIEHKLTQKYRSYDQQNDCSNKKQHFQGTQTWIGLHPQALQTPYNDIFEALSLIKNLQVDRVVDIGAAYGRIGLVMNALFPLAQFTGYEILRQRQAEGNRIFKRLNLLNCEIVNTNVLDDDFVLPKAQVYFIYDFSEMEDISKILDELLTRMNEYSFFLITKGDRVDYLLNRKYKQFTQANGVLDTGQLKIYSSHTDMNQL